MFGKAAQIMNRLEEVLMIALLAGMTIMTFVQVVLRHFFSTGLLWSLEATVYCFAWLVLIGASHGVRTRNHIAVDYISNRLGPGARRFVGLAGLTLCLLYTVFMLYGSAIYFDRVMTLGHYARDIPLPRWLLISILPASFVLLAARFAGIGWGLVSGSAADLGFGRNTA